MQDQMTPKERWKTLKNGDPADRLPVTLFHPEFAAKYSGMTYFESIRSARNLANREIKMYQDFGLDEVSLMYINLPKSSTNLIHKIDDIDQLDLADYPLSKDRRLVMNRQALDLIEKEIGQEAIISYGLVGPLTLAGNILPIKELMKAIIKSPDLVHQFLQFCTDYLIQITQSFADYPFLRLFIYDPVSSGSLISAKNYQSFCQPYTKQLVQQMKQQADDVFIHICGDTSDRLQIIADTGVTGFSLDQKVDLSLAKDTIGDQVTLLGNIDPVHYLLNGSPADIEKEVGRNIDQAKDNPKGYLIRSGCGVPYQAPVENIKAYIQASKRLGRLA